MTNFYIIPGFGESTRDPGYKKIITLAKRRGYNVISYNPVWDRKTATDWLAGFQDLLDKNRGGEKIVLGFSFGAYVAVLAARNNHFKKLLLCSLSPYFSDDISHLPEIAFKMLGKRRMSDFTQYKFPVNINTEAVFLVGDKDFPQLVRRVKKSYRTWQGKKLIKILRGVDHNINNPVYLKALRSLI